MCQNAKPERCKGCGDEYWRVHLKEAAATLGWCYIDRRWLSRGDSCWFGEPCPEIQAFLHIANHKGPNQQSNHQVCPSVGSFNQSDQSAGLKLELQGKDKVVVNMISWVNATKWKMHHLDVCLWLTTSSFCPHYTTLVDSRPTEGVGTPAWNTYNKEH